MCFIKCYSVGLHVDLRIELLNEFVSLEICVKILLGSFKVRC